MHAATHSAAGWVYQQPVLARAGYRAIGYSRRGYFRSDPGDPENPGCAADDLDHLVGFLKLGQVDLVAAAHGAFFALDFALAHPHKVRGLTIVSSLMGITDADYAAVNARLRPRPSETETGPEGPGVTVRALPLRSWIRTSAPLPENV